MKPNEYKISSEKFNFVQDAGKIHDKELSTKPVSYLKDAFSRFKKNKGSIVAAMIILVLVIFSVIGPIASPYTVAYNDAYLKLALPKNQICDELGLNFWDGCTVEEINKLNFSYKYAIGLENVENNGPIKNQEWEEVQRLNNKKQQVTYYKIRKDSYRETGVIFMSLTKDQYNNLQQYQNETGKQVIYPITEINLRPDSQVDAQDANFWYQTEQLKGKTNPVLDEKGNYINIYKEYSGTDGYTSTVRIEENGDKKYDYAIIDQTGYSVRVDYYEYYVYYHSYVLKDGITEPSFIFGATAAGKDIFTCLSGGARFSFILAIFVSFINLLVGAIYGAIEGYYGGKIDLVMERFVEILSAVPFMIVITLLKYHMEGTSPILILIIAFFLTGWIGMAGRTRMQFYRFKNQEYVLAARTLGATDRRIMFKHIFPNALGTLITSCVLVIPSVIFSETSLTYLGIINLSTGNLTSVGTLLAESKSYLVQAPHTVFFPAMFICLLMLSFNLFGNGLRDAFNPSLRGAEE